MLTAERRKEIKKNFSGFPNPITVVDENFQCLYSNSVLIPESSNVMNLFTKTVFLPITKPVITSALIKGASYSARIVPFDEGLYVCEFFDYNTVLSLAENNCVYEKLYPMALSLEYNISVLWRGYGILRSKLENENGVQFLGCLSKTEEHLIELNSVLYNIVEYMNLLFEESDNNKEFIELTSMTHEIVDRANELLDKSNRRIDYVHEPTEIYISAQRSHVVSVMLNALQNSLMYSTRECVPYLTVTKRRENDVDYACVQIRNDSIASAQIGSGEDPVLNFSAPRLGFGTSIIKRFSEISGGSFSLVRENENYITTIKLPLIPGEREKRGVGVARSSYFVYFKTDIPDILEIKMKEINILFGE